MPTPTTDSMLRFGRFEISAAECVLRVDGQPAALGARGFDLLLALAERRDRLVGKQELLDLVWPGVEQRPRAAARLSGYADATDRARGLIRHANEAAARARSAELARAALGELQHAALLDEGLRLRGEQVPALAFATTDTT